MDREPIHSVLRQYKNDTSQDKDTTGWGIILARILIGYLEEHRNPDAVDIIIANPCLLYTSDAADE